MGARNNRQDAKAAKTNKIFHFSFDTYGKSSVSWRSWRLGG